MNLDDVFGAEGALAERLPGFTYRAAQQRMAELVVAALESGRHAVIEAGTGIGKTFAYLLPLLLLTEVRVSPSPLDASELVEGSRVSNAIVLGRDGFDGGLEGEILLVFVKKDGDGVVVLGRKAADQNHRLDERIDRDVVRSKTTQVVLELGDRRARVSSSDMELDCSGEIR